MAWWIWILIGLSLFVVEVFIPTDFFMFFLGLAALVVGVGVSGGVLPALWIQAVVFAVVAVASLVFLRRPITKRWASPDAPPHRAGEIVGESVVLTEDVEANGSGKAELRGTTWTVRTMHEGLTAGSRCRVDKVEGLVLWVSPEPRPGAE